MPGDLKVVDRLVERARADGRDRLSEQEGYELLAAAGVPVPLTVELSAPREVGELDLDRFPGDRVVVKAAAPEITHKTDVGGVRVLPKEREAIERAWADFRDRLGDGVRCLVCEYVAHDDAPGAQLLLAARWTADFGPIVALGPGGVEAEFLAERLDGGRATALFCAGRPPAAGLGDRLSSRSIVRLATGVTRRGRVRIEPAKLERLVTGFLELAAASMPALGEIEVNPLALTARGPVALDVLVSLGAGLEAQAPPRPVDKLGCLLRPRSIAIAGVSRSMNPGRIILQNVLRAGFDPERLWIVKPGEEDLEGCRCVPDLASLPSPVELLVLAIDAEQAVEAVERVVADHLAESVILIPGGLGERDGTARLEDRLRVAIETSRETTWRGPLVNGGNCLGLRSVPGRVDTLFIPPYKLPARRGDGTPLAVVSQSGAFAVSVVSKLDELDPRYVISAGNQVDLTVGDYLAALGQDPDVDVFACYVEGFRPGDGRRWLEAAAEIVHRGKPVILYRAGRTAAGVEATASHTASIAGDYAVTRELAESAGVVVAETLADFDALVRTFCALGTRQTGGFRLGAMSNAGFESVAIADNLGPFEPAAFDAATEERLRELFGRYRLAGVVGVRNPLDVTPIFDDAAFAEAAAILLDDPNVDVGLVGCVPLTGALQTLPASGAHSEDLGSPDSVVVRLARLARGQRKAWVAVVDAGRAYDAMAVALARAGVPTFRSADQALRVLAAVCRFRAEFPTR